MISNAGSPEAYIESLPADRKQAVSELRNVILKNIPSGFTEVMCYGMIGYVVPLSLYPKGYHVDPTKGLPFINIASQKNAISLYHMGIYGDPGLLKWFTSEYAKQMPTRLDMGKSCIRFKKPDQIPYKLIGELVRKMTPADWIARYEQIVKR